MQTVRHITPMVKRNLNLLRTSRAVELDGGFPAQGMESLDLELDVCGAFAGVGTGEVWRGVDLDLEVCDVVFRGDTVGDGVENGLFDGVGACDHESAVEEEETDGVVEAFEGRGGTFMPALAFRSGWVVDEDFLGGVCAEAEPLGAFFAAVEPDDGPVGEEVPFDHGTAFGHGIHFPSGVGVEGLDASARGVCWRSDVLVGASTADHHVGSPFVGARKGQEHGTAGVGIGAVVSWHVRQGFDDSVAADVEDLGRLCNEDHELAIIEEVHKGVHIVGFVLGQDLERRGGFLVGAIGVEELVRRVVIGFHRRIKTVERAGCDEQRTVRHGLDTGIPTSAVNLVTWLRPCLTVKAGVCGRS